MKSSYFEPLWTPTIEKMEDLVLETNETNAFNSFQNQNKLVYFSLLVLGRENNAFILVY